MNTVPPSHCPAAAAAKTAMSMASRNADGKALIRHGSAQLSFRVLTRLYGGERPRIRLQTLLLNGRLRYITMVDVTGWQTAHAALEAGASAHIMILTLLLVNTQHHRDPTEP